jgi:type IV pilus assembly protein PilN
MQVIQQLQLNRPEIVHRFDELVRIIPDGVYLLDYKQSGKKISVNGLAQSNARVSALMRNIESSPWFTNPKLNVIKSDKKDAEATRRFSLVLQQTSQKDQEVKK